MTPPEKNALMSSSMAAVGAWLFALCAALTKLAKEALGWLRERRTKVSR